MDCTVNHRSGLVDTVPCIALDVSIEINLDEVGSSDFFIRKAQRIDQKAPFLARSLGRDVVVDQVCPPVMVCHGNM